MNYGDKIRAVANFIERNVDDADYQWSNTNLCFIGWGQRAGILKSRSYPEGCREIGLNTGRLALIIMGKPRRAAVRAMREYVDLMQPVVVIPPAQHYQGLPALVRAVFNRRQKEVQSETETIGS